MKLIFLGTGSAFTVGDGNYQSNMILCSPHGRNLLIDCGSDVRMSLYEQGLSYRDVDAVYISHLHADHVGGLEWLAFTNKFDLERKHKPILLVSEDIVEDLWNKVLSGGLSSLMDEAATLTSYFDVKIISSDQKFCWEGIDFQLVKTVHFMSNYFVSPSYGFIFFIRSKQIFITTDTQFTLEHLMPYYLNSYLIFQDCETSPLKSGYHAHYSDLVALDSKIKEKMWLYHYQPGNLPDAKKDGFKGFVKKGQDFDLETS